MKLKKGDKCPNCNLGNGLRPANAIELNLTGWEKYSFLHCDTCGQFYVGKNNQYEKIKLRPFTE